MKYVDVADEEFQRFKVEPGDLIINRTNSKELVGKCEVFRESGDWIFASYLIRIRINPKRAIPQFVSDFLNSPAGRLQIDRLSRQIIGMTNINAEELKQLLIPLPSDITVQAKMVALMDTARNETRQLQDEADRRWKSAKSNFDKGLLAARSMRAMKGK